MEYRTNAMEKHRSGYNCSQALYCAFADRLGMSDAKARVVSAAWSGGRMVKCGAVYAAEEILRTLCPDEADEKIAEYERLYSEINGTVECARMRSLANPERKPCNIYVGDAAEVLAKVLDGDGK